MTRIIQRIDKEYVGEDCIQKMIGYSSYLAIFGNGENLYCDFPNCELNHTYLEDYRRKYFPYSNIPTHTKRILLKKYKFANQLFNFDTPYFILSSELSVFSYALRDGTSALLVNDFFEPTQIENEFVTREELDTFFDTVKEGIKYFYYKGMWGIALQIPSQEEIELYFKKSIRDCIENQHIDNYYKNILTSLALNASSKYIPNDFQFMQDDILMVSSKEKELSVSLVSVRYVNENCFKIIKKVAPVSYYTLEQVKNMNEKIRKVANPKIKLLFNPNLIKEDNKDAKLARVLK